MKRLRQSGLLAILLALTTTGLLQGQAPGTMSHQGLLTDTLGTPVPDASRSMTFKIYSTATEGTALWSETKSVETVGGVYSTVLGSTTPITGVDFGQQLWLGVAVAPDAEMSPRAALTSSPSSFAVVNPLINSLQIQTNDLGTNGTEGLNEDLSVLASDAQVGLYSNNSGMFGSGFQLGEIVGGALTNKWSIFRKTTGGDASLNFTYGDQADYSLNPTVFRVDTTGGIEAASFEYTTTQTRHLQLPISAFRPAGDPEFNTGLAARPWWIQFDGYVYMLHVNAALTRLDFTAPVHLPDSAVVKSLEVRLYDNDAANDLQVYGILYRRDVTSAASPVRIAERLKATTGSSTSLQFAVDSTIVSPTIDNQNYEYYVFVWVELASGSAWSQDLRFYGAAIKYEITNAGH